VLTTSFISPAVLQGVENVGAVPVFVDVDPATYSMCPTAAAAAVTPRTRILLPLHTHGHPADMKPLLDLAQSRGLQVVEDVTEAVGARYDGRPVGTLGDMGVFGFEEGSVIVTRDKELAAWLWRLRRGEEPDHPRDHEEKIPVLNPMSEANAAKLSLRLARMELSVAVRRRVADLYGCLLGGVLIPLELPEMRHVYTRYAIRSVHRDALRTLLRTSAVETELATPLHLQPSYRSRGYNRGRLPATERLTAETLFLPIHLGLTEEEVRGVVRTIHGGLSQVPVIKQAA
jgi:dTDP-4-amino-4,6-dideoxygalactose transaminase